jgi:hypothetical protein
VRHMKKTFAAATLALATVLGTAGLAVGWLDDERQARPSGEVLLEREIAAMEASGIATDHPKLVTLREELDDLRAGARRQPHAPAEPGVDLSDVSASRARQERHDAALWDDGVVQCEPIPPDLLTVEEIAGAACRSLPQPDGSSLYVATRPDGTEHTVRFGSDGSVVRLPR